MGPLVIVLLGAVAVFWYLGLLTPKRLRIMGGIGGLLIGLYILARGQAFVGLGLGTVGGYLLWSALRAPPPAGMTRRRAAKLLGVRTSATPDEIRTAYRLAMASAHPDRGGSDAASAELNAARDVLMAGAAPPPGSSGDDPPPVS
ncbi:MAG: DnaJ domain-containing protein [Pseudomonadota bacterium]